MLQVRAVPALSHTVDYRRTGLRVKFSISFGTVTTLPDDNGWKPILRKYPHTSKTVSWTCLKILDLLESQEEFALVIVGNKP